MHIKNLELVNFQGIKEFNADFEGNVYFLTGDNEKGKSTILKSIGTILGITRDEVLKKGEEKGFAKAVIGDDNQTYHVELKFTKANPKGSLTVKTESGMKTDNLTSIQKIFGYTEFDAVEFVTWSNTAEGRRKQIEVVKKLMSDDIQKAIEGIDADVSNSRELRKEANADVKTYTTLFKNSGDISKEDLEKYSSPVNMEELLASQEKALKLKDTEKKAISAIEEKTKLINDIPNIHKNNEELKTSSLEKENEILRAAEKIYKEAQDRHKKNSELIKSDFEKRNDEIETNKVEYQNSIDKANKWLSDFEKVKDKLTDPSTALENAQKHNEKHLLVQKYNEAKESMEKAVKKASHYEDTITKLLEEREQLINSASLPIEGLSFTEDGLELHGIPFESGKVSDSQIMEVAAKLIIASNPTTKIFRIARGESLGEQRLQDIINIAKANGFQGFIEQVVRGQHELLIEEYTEA